MKRTQMSVVEAIELLAEKLDMPVETDALLTLCMDIVANTYIVDSRNYTGAYDFFNYREVDSQDAMIEAICIVNKVVLDALTDNDAANLAAWEAKNGKLANTLRQLEPSQSVCG